MPLTLIKRSLALVVFLALQIEPPCLSSFRNSDLIGCLQRSPEGAYGSQLSRVRLTAQQGAQPQR